MLCYVDTNVVIRYLTNDVPQQADRVKQRLLQAKEGKLNLAITSFTIVEILFILQSWYKLTKDEAVTKLQTFISPDWIKVEKKKAVLGAFEFYKEKNIDFVDLLNFSVAKEDKAKILSFDKDFDKLTPKLRVEP